MDRVLTKTTEIQALVADSQKAIKEMRNAIPAHHSYQLGLLYYRSCWSGGDLQGKAKKYGVHYKNSRDSVLRMNPSNRLFAGKNGKSLLMVGALSDLINELPKTKTIEERRERVDLVEAAHKAQFFETDISDLIKILVK